MICVFDGNFKDNKWLYILQGHFLNRLKIIANFAKIAILQLATGFYNLPEYEILFL